MTTKERILAFGAASGLVWTFVPGLILDLFQSPGETVGVFGCGLAAGIVVSFLLSYPLRRFGSLWSLAFGAGALPVGAFIFGVLQSILQPSFGYVTDVSGETLVHRTSPLGIGFGLAVLSLFSIYTVLLLPLAQSTTYLLRLVILRGEKPPE